MKTKSVLMIIVLIVAVFFLIGCESRNNRSVVAVIGAGTVMAQPDTVNMTISLSRTAATTRQAQEEVNVMVTQTLAILEDAGIESRNIGTTLLRFNPEYDWRAAGRVLVGQKAEQVISFSASINANDETEANMVSNIIDQLIQIDGIQLHQMNFSVSDTDELFVRARELAFQKALEKAEQYAQLSGMRIMRTMSITEEGLPNFLPFFNRALNQNMGVLSAERAASDGSAAALPTGEVEITSQIMVEFLLR